MATEQSRLLQKYSPKIPSQRVPGSRTQTNERLYSSLANASSNLDSVLGSLQNVDEILPAGAATSFSTADAGGQSPELVSAVLVKSAVSTLSVTMDRVLSEALQAEHELEWWRSVENSRWNTAYFLLQTSPLRVARLAREISSIAQRNQVQLSFANLNRETFRLRIAPHLEVFSSLFPKFSRHQSFINRYAPSELARQECTAHRKELEVIRDLRAQQLGQLAYLGTTFVAALQEAEDASFAVNASSSSSLHGHYTAMSQLLASSMDSILSGDGVTSPSVNISPSSASTSLERFISTTLPRHSAEHQEGFVVHERPGKWTLAWPRYVFLPPLFLLAARSAYHNRDSIYANILDAGETIQSFWVQWVLEPVADILKTVRTGGDDTAGRVISKDGLKSDMASLERMVVAFAQEKQNISEADLDALRRSIREGDLTTVLEVYEGDIKTPVRSAVSGTLIRSLLIQVQKAKVDIDLALAGIDKLLRSQELTFGFVGVAPSLAVVYAVGGWLRTLLWPGAKGSKSKFGGRRNRRASFYAIRRIERLLTQAHSATANNSKAPTAASSFHASLIQSLSASSLTPTSAHISFTAPVLPLDPQTHGQLILNLTHLRHFAEHHMSKRGQQQQREAFLEDLADLEDARLGKEDKLRVVQRMWRSWGGVLGWGDERYT